MGKYSNLNVLDMSQLSDWQDQNAVEQVTAMINKASKNRSTRRKIEKSLGKTASIFEHCEKRANERATKELNMKVDQDLIWICAAVGLTLYEDYHWKEDQDNEHGQITSFLERLTKRMYSYTAEEGRTPRSAEDLAKELFEKTGIMIM